MENKLLELFEKQDTVSMNDDIFPLVEEEFAGQVMGNEVYELAHQYIGQLLWSFAGANPRPLTPLISLAISRTDIHLLPLVLP